MPPTTSSGTTTTGQSGRRTGRSGPMRAFRAVRAYRAKEALRQITGAIPGMRLLKYPTRLVVTALKCLNPRRRNARVHKRLIFRRSLKALGRGALAVTLLPVSYAAAIFLPEGSARATQATLSVISGSPANFMSRFMGKVASSKKLPYSTHQRMISMVTKMYGIDNSEVEKPITEYNTLNEFFCRRLKPGSRVPHPHAPLTSPCDGEILQLGKVTDGNVIVQVKGIEYSIEQLTLSEMAPPRQGHTRWYFLFHLRPKDYHRFHSPANFQVHETVKIPGTLCPVTQTASKWIPNLFVINERVSVLGSWEYGPFCMVPVGATCVGSISLGFDESIKTNQGGVAGSLGSLLRGKKVKINTTASSNLLALEQHHDHDDDDANYEDDDAMPLAAPTAGGGGACSSDVELSATWRTRKGLRGGGHRRNGNSSIKVKTPGSPLTTTTGVGAVMKVGRSGGTSGVVPFRPKSPCDSEPFVGPEPIRKTYAYPQPVLAKGQEMGWFNWGSAIALIVDLPENVGMMVKPGQEVAVGEPLCGWNSITSEIMGGGTQHQLM